MNPKKNILTWVLFFISFFIILQFFKKGEPPPELTTGNIGVAMTKSSYVQGEDIIVELRNNTQAAIIIPSNCPKNPLKILAWDGSSFQEKSHSSPIDCSQVKDIQIPPQDSVKVSFAFWNNSLFGQLGRYKIEVPSMSPEGAPASSPEFTVVEPGFFRSMFRAAFYRPIYNVLLFLIDVVGHNLGFAIILLTIIIRLILLVPSQRAIVSQRKMQEVQPKLEHIKKKYAGNQEMIAQETMKIWRENKVNPFGSCLPLIVQFPILIALYYAIQSGLNPDNIYLAYSPLKSIDLAKVNTMFLGILDLKKANLYVLPLIIGALQFVQLKLAAVKKKKDEKDKKEEKPSEIESATKSMTYVMPVMIALFTASVPAGVGLYWGISTTFGIIQQLVANKKSV